MKMFYFSILFSNVYAHKVPLANQNGKIPFCMNNRGWAWVMHVDSACLVSEFPMGCSYEACSSIKMSNLFLPKCYWRPHAWLLCWQVRHALLSWQWPLPLTKNKNLCICRWDCQRSA